ncbi:MAG: hypothetical protein WCA10_07490 [Terracidiphilus sp.]
MTTNLTEPRNRLQLVIESTTVNGIDFIELKAVDATTLYIHFLNAVNVNVAGIAATIAGGDRITGITVSPIQNAVGWTVDANGNPILAVNVSTAGDFSTYTLTITGAPLDPMYMSAPFSFKVLCPSDFDCDTTPACCAAPEPPLPAIDYLAKDFQSFNQALKEFSTQRYPAWQERSEADFGMMFMEALSAVADELSYLQDRVAAESALLTATQRRSLVSMARLVDYEPAPTLSASTILQCQVVGASVPAGSLVSAVSPSGVKVPFEIGTGLADTTKYTVSPLWNSIQPYWFDDNGRCLPCGANGMYILGQGFDFPDGLPLLIQTDLPGESIREIVYLIAAKTAPLSDEIYPVGGPLPTLVTWIQWTNPTQRDHDLTNTIVYGNLLQATQGQRFSESFVVGTAPKAQSALPAAIARFGPDGTADTPNWVFRYPLSKTQGNRTTLFVESQPRLTWLPPGSAQNTVVDPDVAKPLPEIILSRRLPEPQTFEFTTTLLDSTPIDFAYTVDPGAWRLVNTTQAGLPSQSIQWEYDGDQGGTLRFGFEGFGQPPNDGDVYDVTYRIGLGATGNVAAEAIHTVDSSASVYLAAVRNPFIVTNGADQETALHIQRMAPQAFRFVQYRAVRPEDYVEAAETLPWVLSAGTAFRWTGSWLTVFTTADPRGNAPVTEVNQISLVELLNRRKLAGYESYAPPSTLVALDLVVTVCAATGWLESDVEAGVLARLANAKLPNGSAGFFYSDAFTFGTPLYRSALDAAIQSVPGVNGVLDIEYRRRGASDVFRTLPDILPLGTSEILRIENDPSYPERGTLRVIAEGGR